MHRPTKLPMNERYMMRQNNQSTESMRAARRQKQTASARDRQMARHIQNRPSMQASLSQQEKRMIMNRRLGNTKFTPKATLNHTNLSLNDRFYMHRLNKSPPEVSVRNNVRRQRHNRHRRHHQQQQMMEIDNQPPLQSGLDNELKQRLGKKSNVHHRLGRPLRGGTSMTGRGGGMILSRGRGGAAMKEALSTGGGRVARGALRRRRRQSAGGPVRGEGGRGVGARGGGDDSRSGSDRRGGFTGRGGRRRRRGRGDERPAMTREQLDNQLDTYMSKTKSHLDAELDAYMAQKTGS